MDQVESISSILGSAFDTGVTAVEADPAPPAEAPKAETTDVTQTTEQIATPAQEEVTEAPVKETEVDGRTVALREARERYRKAEARLRELEQAQQAPKVSIFEDEDKGIAQRITEHARPLREATFNMSVKLARLTYKDSYEAAETAFFSAAEADPRLYEQLRAASDPGEFIHTVGTQISELGPVGGDFMKYREKVTGELKSELAKRDETINALKAQIDALTKAQKDLESLPRSLNQGSSEAAPKAVDAGPEDINELVRFK